MHSAHLVLVVAPDDELRRSIAFALEAEGFAVSPHRRLRPVLDRARGGAFDCMVVDENTISGRSGLRTLSGIACPIVLLIDRLRFVPGDIAVTPLAKPMLGRALTETVAFCIAQNPVRTAGMR